MAKYAMTGGTGAPTVQEATGALQFKTVTIDKTTVLAGVAAGTLVAGTLLAPNTTSGKYEVADETAFGVTQEARHVVMLPTDLEGLAAADKEVAAILVGTWTSRFYLNNGPLTPANQDLFDQRLILSWD